jgi:hypothetical protein
MKTPKLVFECEELRIVQGVEYSDDYYRDVDVYVFERRCKDALGNDRWESEDTRHVPSSNLSRVNIVTLAVKRLLEKLPR